MSARWVPHLLTDGQKKQKVKIAKQLLKIFPKYDEKKFANGDESGVHYMYFEPVSYTGRLAIKYGPPKKQKTNC